MLDAERDQLQRSHLCRGEGRPLGAAAGPARGEARSESDAKCDQLQCGRLCVGNGRPVEAGDGLARGDAEGQGDSDLIGVTAAISACGL